MKKSVVAVILLGTGLLSGCVHRVADLTYVSTKTMSQEEFAFTTTDGEKVEGKDSAHIILIFPTGNPNAEEALDRAIEKKKGGVALKNASIYSSWFYIPYIYGRSTITVKGEVLTKE